MEGFFSLFLTGCNNYPFVRIIKWECVIITDENDKLFVLSVVPGNLKLPAALRWDTLLLKSPIHQWTPKPFYPVKTIRSWRSTVLQSVIMALLAQPEAHITWAPAKFCFKSWQSCLFPVAFWSSKISSMQFTREGSFRKDPKPNMQSTICESSGTFQISPVWTSSHKINLCELCSNSGALLHFPFCDSFFS